MIEAGCLVFGVILGTFITGFSMEAGFLFGKQVSADDTECECHE